MYPAIGSTHKRSEMAALAAVLSRATGIKIDVDTLRPVLILCSAGLLLSLLLIISGFDLGSSSSDWIPPA
jgi:hypothetical protein